MEPVGSYPMEPDHESLLTSLCISMGPDPCEFLQYFYSTFTIDLQFFLWNMVSFTCRPVGTMVGNHRKRKEFLHGKKEQSQDEG